VAHIYDDYSFEKSYKNVIFHEIGDLFG